MCVSSGIIRDDCVYMYTWQSYKCFGMNYRMLAIESLDADTELRRLSPVAVLGNGFVDLINGEKIGPRQSLGEFGGMRLYSNCLSPQVPRTTGGARATPARREFLSSTASSPPVSLSTSTSAASVLRSSAS